MNLTSKSRYALKIMMDLAHYGTLHPLVRRSEIAARQGIPADYLDQIMMKLRAGHLVESTRGRSGGYRLFRPADDITVWDLVSAVEDNVAPVECISSGQVCDHERHCSSKDAWSTIFGALKTGLSAITLGQLARQWVKESPAPHATDATRPTAGAYSADVVQECRGGGRFDHHAITPSMTRELDQGVRRDG